ncbi:uncharacterized protein BDV14DRAFT_202189 [Aspergillus stella-maris]|uniref:uncharacterized protein n=1 Tax=Aspergillus stella-maris TaxID=1810926 RepID=UPI003CCCB8D7
MPLHRYDDYTAAWICALPLELAAACAMLDERHDSLPVDPDSRDTNNYVLGKIAKHNVVVACLPYGVTGTVSAARVVNQMLATFKRIKFGLMIGIGGGAPSAEHDIRLGDVVVGSPRGMFGGVIQYDFGKTVQKGRFQRTGMLNKPPEVLLTALSNLQAKHLMEGHRIENTISEMMNKYPMMSFQYARPPADIDRLYLADHEHPEDQPTCRTCDQKQLVDRATRPPSAPQPYVHYGLIASGDQVVKHGRLRDQLRKELDVLCFEMEAAGLVDSFPCLIIRGVSDYADSHKNDVWQGYAAATAAAYAHELMQVMPVGNGDRQDYEGREMDAVASEVRFRVQEWLSPASFKDDLHNHQSDYMDGSCDWALKSNAMKLFLKPSQESKILRIGGAPGIGKSTLTGLLIGQLVEAGNPNVFYFFCKDTAEGKSRPYQALRTILSQALVLDTENRVYPWLEQLRIQSGQPHVESPAVLQEALMHALLALPSTSNSLCIVVDALDECENGVFLASALTKVLNASNRPFKLLLTSREEPDLMDFFSQYNTKMIAKGLASLFALTVQPSSVRQPVRSYIQERVTQLRHIRDTPLGEQVLKEVTAATDGSWLYARLILDEIGRSPSPASVARQLQNIPTGLVDLYRTIFTTVENALTASELVLAQQLFIWIDMKDFVLVGRGTLDKEILDVVFQAANSGEEVFNSIDLAQRLSSPLIALKGESSSSLIDGTLGVRINFVHHTATQFVRQCAAREGSFDVPTVLKPQPLKALYRAKTAIWYFEHSERAASLQDHLIGQPRSNFKVDEGAYFEMAYALWGAFFLQTLPDCLDDEDLEQASALCNQLTDFLLSGRCLKWIEMAIIINYDGEFTNLFSNAIKAFMAATESLKSTKRCNSLPAFRTFSLARRQFFADYAYVIACTGPVDRRVMAVPDGFESRPLATALMRLGRKWTHLY